MLDEMRCDEYLVGSILDIVGTAGRDEGVQRLVLRRQRTTVFVPDFTFLHRALATYDDRSASLCHIDIDTEQGFTSQMTQNRSFQ